MHPQLVSPWKSSVLENLHYLSIFLQYSMPSMSYQQISEHSEKVSFVIISSQLWCVQSTVHICAQKVRLFGDNSLPFHSQATLYVSSFHCTSCWGCRLQWVYDVSWSFRWLLIPDLSTLKSVWRSIAVLEPPKSQPHSQAISPDKTCNKVSDVNGKGNKVFRPAQCTSVHQCVDQNVNMKVQWSSSSTSCCFFQFIGHSKTSVCLWIFTLCFSGECGKLNARGNRNPQKQTELFFF